MSHRPAAVPDVDDLPVELADIGELKLDPQNARTHGTRNLEAIRQSLHQFGQRKPLVVTQDRVVRAGNGTLTAMRRMNEDRTFTGDDGQQHEWRRFDKVWITVFPGSADEALAYAINDNRSGDLADWDERILAEHLRYVADEGGHALLLATGFDRMETDELIEAMRRADAHAAGEFVGQVRHTGLNELAEHYDNKATRTLVLEYPNEQFAWVVEQLGAYREEHELESNAAALYQLIEVWVNGR